MQINGNANYLLADISGASNILLVDFELNNANVSLSGLSKANIKLNGTLDASLSGVSSLTYYGNPTLGNINVSGGSAINKG